MLHCFCFIVYQESFALMFFSCFVALTQIREAMAQLELLEAQGQVETKAMQLAGAQQ